MEPLSTTLVALAIVIYAVFSRRAERSPITPPMFFVTVGAVLGRGVLDVDESVIDGLAELSNG